MIGYVLFFFMISLIDILKTSLAKKYLLAFWLISLFSGLRYGIGFDYFTYYENMMDPNYNPEIIPSCFLFLGREIHYSIFYLASSLFTNFFFLRGMYLRNCPFSALYFYIGYPLFFYNSLSIIRQFMAISVIFYLICLDKPKVVVKIALIVIAFFCHRSSVVSLFLLLPIPKNVGQKSLFILFALSLLVGEMLVGFVISMSSDFFLLADLIRYLSTEMAGGNMMKWLVYVTITVIAFKYNSLIKYGIDRRYIIYSIFGGCLFALFSLNANVGQRFCAFYLSSILIYITSLCVVYKIPGWAYKIICVAMFASVIYISHITSLSEISNSDKYKINGQSLYYPYEMIFWNSPE